jgi:hypothetical protein
MIARVGKNKRKTTIYDVAAAVGASVSTVTHAFWELIANNAQRGLAVRHDENPTTGRE